MIVVIDGPAGTGKSTVARILSERQGLFFLETGAMYRCVALAIEQKSIDPENTKSLIDLLHKTTIELVNGQFVLNGQIVDQELRTPSVCSLTSKIATLDLIRAYIVPLQRKLVQGLNAVAEGRDLGTIVFPQADVKIFLTSDPLIRAKRRLLQEGGDLSDKKSIKKIQKQIEERDHKDSTRLISPLKQAEDAHFIDSSEKTIEEVVKEIEDLL